MNQVKFAVEGVEGDFFCDADEMKSYRTLKQLTLSEKNLAGMFEAMERVYMGNDAEYVERVGGIENIAKLNDAAAEAVNAKNSSASSRSSKRTGAKQ